MNFTPSTYKSSVSQNHNNLLSLSLYNSGTTLFNQDDSGSSSLSTPDMNTSSPLLDTFGLSQDPFLDTPQHNNNQPQLPLAGSSSWNMIQPLARTQSGYMHSLDQIQSLLKDNERLCQENLMLAVGKAAIEEALQKLVCTLNSQGCEPVTPQAPPIDHSKLQFFTSMQFNTWLRCADANMKECGSLPFLEDVNGQSLSRVKKAAICQSMCELWQGFKIKNQAPLKWKKGDPALQELFQQEMVTKHPELGLCMDNWKINYIATEQYPSWASTHLKDQKQQSNPRLSNEKLVKKRPLTLFSTSSIEDSSDELTDSPLLSKKPKLGHNNLETPISLTPSSPKIAPESDQHESPRDVNVISTSTPSVIHTDSSTTNEADLSLDAKSATISTFPSISDVLNGKSAVRPLPRMIPSAMTTTPLVVNSPSSLLVNVGHNSAPSPTESKLGPSNVTPPIISASDSAVLSPTPSASTTNAKCMRPDPNKNGRTLCVHRWLNGVAKDGTTADFKIYWTALLKDTKKKYKLEAAQLVASGVWHANTADVVLNVLSGTVY
ncbi:uncharacterized protein EDB91DRAFT_1254661 [Suillus paluster]|uniref:uncharacterized protein n=1 Tax=Suillus paluster TaxID=48578 RepID=UPI001B87E7AA|nr:uncharacterized protein EDB91DRAFT_1254661 [Suillus paluster]KAG1725613.1 hypothetical protein EDB91DRAFT_1254661 [Suillus paluster]